MPANRRSQKNPIPIRDEAFLLDPFEWVEGTVLEDYCPEDDAGFFHVTTNLERVLADSRLRSRSDVGIVGLGGGHTDKPGKHVSFTITRSRALWLFEAMVGLNVEAREGTAASVLKLALGWTGFPGDAWSYNWDEDDEGDSKLDDLGDLCAELNMEPPDDIQALMFGGPWEDMIRRESKGLEEKWGRNASSRYELAQFFEERLESTFYIPEWFDDGTCVPLVGFTASAAQYLRLRAENFSICQAAVAEGRPYADMITKECELRFDPADVQLVSVEAQDERNVIPVPSRFD